MTKIALRLTASLLPLLAVAAAPPPQPVTPMSPDVVASYDPVLPQADFIKRTAMVPMRDGTKLYTVIFMKKGTTNGPILLSRTSYDAKGSTARTPSQHVVDVLPIMYKEFVEDGYIIVQQDIRGLHNSEGTFVMNRPIVGPLNKTGIDESTDAYDTIDWLVKHVPESNGRVGTIGSSYLGFLTLASEINPHPALKAAVPQSPMVDGWMATTGSTTALSASAASTSRCRKAPARPTPARACRSGPATIIPAISKPDRWATTPARCTSRMCRLSAS